MKIKSALLSVSLAALMSGCVAAGGNYYSGIKTGNQDVVNEAATMPMGTTFSEKLVMPQVEKLPIKIEGWSYMSRETRTLLTPYVHTTGDYLPVTVRMEVGNHNTGMKHGSSSGIMVMKGAQYKDYGIIITSWTEDKNILLDIPVSGSCIYYNKSRLGGGNSDTSYIYTAMEIAEHNAMVEVVKKLDENRAKINSLYNEYQKSKEVF